MRGLMLLCIMMLAGDAMGFPRGRILSTNDAINRKFLTAAQEGRYSPEAWIRPATMDAAAAGLYAIASFGTDGSWVVTRLKGVVRTSTFRAVEFNATNLGGTTAQFCVAVCAYEETAAGVTVKEMARAYASVLSATTTEVVRADLNVPVELSASNKYAVALFVENAGAGAGVYMAPDGAVAQPFLWGGGTTPVRTISERVEFTSNDTDVRLRVPVTSPDSTAVPYIALVRGFDTDSWY